MNKLLSNDQRGVGHLGLILAVVVVLALGGVGYFVYTKNKSSSGSLDNAVADAIKNAKCEYDDKDLCKFFTGFEAQKYYTVNFTSTEADGTKSDSSIQWSSDGKSYMKFGGETAWEVISIDNATYTKAADDTWWKSVSKPADTTPDADDYKPAYDDDDAEAVASKYKKIGKEACGNLTCFKYQEINSATPGTTHYFWFDDRDYQLRRDRTEADGTVTDSTFSYDKVSIKEPSPVKELAPNQYLIPGQSEPTTIPDTSDSGLSPEELQQLMDQYEQ